jgi:hypothetical protein
MLMMLLQHCKESLNTTLQGKLATLQGKLKHSTPHAPSKHTRIPDSSAATLFQPDLQQRSTLLRYARCMLLVCATPSRHHHTSPVLLLLLPVLLVVHFWLRTVTRQQPLIGSVNICHSRLPINATTPTLLSLPSTLLMPLFVPRRQQRNVYNPRSSICLGWRFAQVLQLHFYQHNIQPTACTAQVPSRSISTLANHHIAHSSKQLESELRLHQQLLQAASRAAQCS